jgi:ketosteroid isomerase-like protein
LCQQFAVDRIAGAPRRRHGAARTSAKGAAMNANEVAQKLVELCKQGKNQEAMETLYSPDIVSIEVGDMPNMPREMRGMQAVAGKGKWWSENNTIHSAEVEGPWPNGNQFIVRFKYDVTNKPMNKRMQMDEVGLYTVENGKIVREQFFYQTGA